MVRIILRLLLGNQFALKTQAKNHLWFYSSLIIKSTAFSVVFILPKENQNQ